METNSMNIVSIHKPDGVATFEKGAKIVRGEKETDITVTKISHWFGKTTITLSDKSQIIFKGFPVSYV